MKFSVAIPTYKRQDDLEKCLDTILTQTVLPVEVILIDDDNLNQDFFNTQKKRFEMKYVGNEHATVGHDEDNKNYFPLYPPHVGDQDDS